jgi:gamma-glutamyltranspeptidase/glutathione hydrolase
MIDLGANVQAASDAARFSHSQATNTLALESNLYNLLGPKLKAMGHKVVSANGDDMGGYQAISFTPFSAPTSAAAPAAQPAPAASSATRRDGPTVDSPIEGIYRGASDHRKDGQAGGW